MDRRKPPDAAELDLVTRAKAGDRDAVGELLAQVERDIHFMAATVHDVDQSEDAAQELRLKVLQAIGRFDVQRCTWPSYIRGRLRFMLIDHFRLKPPTGMRSRNPETREQYPRIRSLDAMRDSFEDGREIYYQPVDEMSAESQDHVELFDLLEVIERNEELRECALYARGYTMKHVGELCGISESRVSQKISAAKRNGLGRYVAYAAGVDAVC